METIFEDIERAISADLHYLAVSAALTIPDICAALQCPPDRPVSNNKAGYLRWYRENMGAAYPKLTGDDAYSLRCGVSHAGRLTPDRSQYVRVIFSTPSDPRTFMHNIRVQLPDQAYLALDASRFCRDMIAAARTWLTAMSKDGNVKQNLDRVVRRRPEGMPPIFDGSPAIA